MHSACWQCLLEFTGVLSSQNCHKSGQGLFMFEIGIWTPAPYIQHTQTESGNVFTRPIPFHDFTLFVVLSVFTGGSPNVGRKSILSDAMLSISNPIQGVNIKITDFWA